MLIHTFAAIFVSCCVWYLYDHKLKTDMAVDWNFRNSFRQEYESIKNQWNLKTKLVNGVNWHYADEGDESNTEKVVLFLHGFPECWYSWHHVLPLIKPNYRLIALDMKGYGESVPEINSSVADFEWHHVGDQIIALMDSLNIPQFYVVSHDWGSIIGSVMVSDHGLSYGQSNTAENHILGYFRLELDLLDIDVYDFGTYAKRLQILLFQSRVITNYLFSNAAKLIDIAYKSRMDTELSDIDRNFTVYTFASDVVKQNVPYYFSTANWDWNSAITKICKNNFTFPVIQLQADHDPAQPSEKFRGVRESCSNITLKWINNSNHFSNYDQPKRIAELINEYLP